MKVLVIHAHPVAESFSARLRETVVESLAKAGHDVVLCDLYRRGFDPVLSSEERIVRYDTAKNTAHVADYVAELRAAEALVLVYPTWWSGFPAILKGWFDRVWLPGVAFDLEGTTLLPRLTNLRKLGAVTTYGAKWWQARLLGNPGRLVVRRTLKCLCHPKAELVWLAMFDTEFCPPQRRAAFLDKVARTMARF